MFVGHYGVSFAAKRVTPTIPLWALFVAVQLLDIFWPPFILLPQPVRRQPSVEFLPVPRRSKSPRPPSVSR